MDIKDCWGVDSSPGTAQDTTHKCGNLFATMGAAGSATIAAYSTDLGDRATVPPGTHPTINTGAATKPTSGPWTATPASLARGASLGFNSKGTVLFDGFAMMYGLTQKASGTTGKVSISFWISPDAGSQGVILGSPLTMYQGVLADYHPSGPPPAAQSQNEAYGEWVQFGPFVGGSNAQSASLFANPAPFTFNYGAAGGGSYTGAAPGGVGEISSLVLQNSSGNWDYGGGATLSGVPHVDNGGSYTAGSDGLFYHVMMGLDTSGGVQYFTLAVNDTVIMNHVVIGPPPFDGSTWSFDSAETWPIHWTRLRDNATQDPTVEDPIPDPNVWNIGGRFTDLSAQYEGSNSEFPCTPEGDGLMGAVTELYINEGVYLDWTSGTIRNKFHTTDILGTVFLPTDLGAHGQTPTSTKPTMYFTGGPEQFVINRVNGVKCSAYKGTRNSLTLDGRYPGAL